MAEHNTYETLKLWGAWAASDRSEMDWSPIAAGFKGALPYTAKARMQCSDEDGLKIDKSIAKLKEVWPESYELLILHFVYLFSMRRIAKIQKCSDGTIRKRLQTILGFISACLFCNY